MSAAARHPSLDELSAWADGEIADDVERRLLDEHVAGCPTCASLVEDFRALAGAQGTASVPPVPSRLEGRVRDALRREGRRADRSSRRFVLPLSAAATLLVGVAALWLVRHRTDTIPLSPPLEQAPASDTAATTAPVVSEPPPLASPPPSPRLQASPGARASVAKKAQNEAAQFAPAPEAPAASPEGVEAGVPGGVQGGVLGGVAEAKRDESPEEERRLVSLGAQEARWRRVLPSRAGDTEREAGLSKERADAPAAGAAAPSADRLASAAGEEACPTMDALEPALTVTGLDLERARALAERARDAGATSSALDGAARLTLLVPPGAWPRVRQVLADAGVVLPEAASAPPPGAACLAVTVVPAAP